MNHNKKVIYFVSICGACSAVAYIIVVMQGIL